MDLRDLFRDEGSLSPRYVLALVIWLPTKGALYASRRGGVQFLGWDVDRYALVSQVNAQRAGNHILLLANRDPSRPKPSLPEPFPTPDKEKSGPPKPGSFAAITASLLSAQRRKKDTSDA